MMLYSEYFFFFFSSRRRHTRSTRDWSSDVCSSDLSTRPICESSTQVGRVDEGRAVGVQLRHEGVAEPVEAGVEGAWGGGEVQGGCEIGRASCRERVWMWGGGGGMRRK